MDTSIRMAALKPISEDQMSSNQNGENKLPPLSADDAAFFGEIADKVTPVDSFTPASKIVVAGGQKKLLSEIGASSSDLFKVPVDQLKVLQNFNVRTPGPEYDKRVEWLADQMFHFGYKKDKPLSGILLNEDGVKSLYIYAGYRRVEAVKMANARRLKEGLGIIESVTVIVQPEGTKVEDLVADLVVGNDGEPLRPFEVGLVARRMRDEFGLDSEVVAHRLKLSNGNYVDGLISVVNGPKEIVTRVLAGVLSVTLAMEMLRKLGSGAVDAVLEGEKKVGPGKKITKGKLPGASDTKILRKHAPQMRDALRKVTADPAYANLSDETRSELDALLAALKEVKAEEENAKDEDGANDGGEGQLSLGV